MWSVLSVQDGAYRVPAGPRFVLHVYLLFRHVSLINTFKHLKDALYVILWLLYCLEFLSIDQILFVIYQSAYLSIYPSIYLSIYLSIYHTYLSIYLYIGPKIVNKLLKMGSNLPLPGPLNSKPCFFLLLQLTYVLNPCYFV